MIISQVTINHLQQLIIARALLSLLMPLLLQLPANLLLFLLLLGWVKILENGSQDWKMARWGSDLMFSTLLLVPLAIWVPRFTNSLLEIVRLSPLGDEKLS